MKRKRTKIIIGTGILCIAMLLVSSWYAVTFNESRLVEPTNLEEYIFNIKDLPMICSVCFICLYVFFLCGLLIVTVAKTKKNESAKQVTRKIDPRLGLLGFSGLLGFLGFWTYRFDKSIFPFAFFMFFGFFSFFYEGKMSDTFMDERYKENKLKAHLKANSIALSIIFFALIVLGQGRLIGNLEYTLIIFVIVVALSIALELFLSQYLLYRYDNDGQFDESGE